MVPHISLFLKGNALHNIKPGQIVDVLLRVSRQDDGTLSFQFLKNFTKNKMFQKKQMIEQIFNQILCPYNPKVVLKEGAVLHNPP